jgi:hypothetical protein
MGGGEIHRERGREGREGREGAANEPQSPLLLLSLFTHISVIMGI